VVELGFEITFGIPEGMPVGAETYVLPVVGSCVAVINVAGSHIEVPLSVPVGGMVCGAVVDTGGELVTVTGLEVGNADESWVTDTGVDVALAVVAIPVPLLVTDAETDATDVGAETVEAEVKLVVPELAGLTTAVEFAVVVPERTVPLEVNGKVELVGSVLGGEVADSVLLVVGGVIVPVSLLVGSEVINVADELTEGVVEGTMPVPELVGVTLMTDVVLPRSVLEAETGLLVGATSELVLVVEPKMLEIMLPRSVVEVVVVGVETPTADDVVADDVTPVEPGPETPAVVVGTELVTPVSVDVVGRLESVDTESVEVVTGDEETGTLEVVVARSELEEIKDDKISVAEVDVDVTLVSTPVTGVDVGTTLETTPVAELVVGITVDSTPVAEVVVGSTTEIIPIGLVEVVGTEAVPESVVAESVAGVVVGTTEDESEVGNIEPIMEERIPGSEVELVGAVEAPVPVPVKEIPEEVTVAALSVLDTLVAEDAPVPEKLTPDTALEADTLVADEDVGSVGVDDTTPLGPNVIALLVLGKTAEVTLEAELAVGETTTAGTDPVDATELEDGVGETITTGALPLEATDATDTDVSDVDSVDSVEDLVEVAAEETLSSKVEETVGCTTLSGTVPADPTTLAALVGVVVGSGATIVVREIITVVTPSTLDVDDLEPVPNSDPENPSSELVPVVPALCVPDDELELEESEEVVSCELVPVIDCRKSERELEDDRLVVEKLEGIWLNAS
jgi:hypothetical protein